MKKKLVCRFQVEISPGGLLELDELQRQSGLATRKELFNNMLSLWRWSFAALKRGEEIISLAPDTQTMSRLAFPAHDHYRNQLTHRLRSDCITMDVADPTSELRKPAE